MYRLPHALRPVLATPFGPVLTTDETLRAVEGRQVIAVGDVVTQTFFAHGITPHVAVIDGVTKRGTVVEAAPEGVPENMVRVRVENPAATLTRALVDALTDALARAEPTLIFVDGEEDLAALPVMMLAPDGTAVCYGQPNEGVVVVVVTEAVRQRAKDIFGQLELE